MSLKYAQQIAYSSKETLKMTYEFADFYKYWPGCFVECGVAAGAQIIAMATAAPDKTIYAFDSFDGIPYPSNRDDQMPGIKMLTPEEIAMLPNPGQTILKSTGATVVTLEQFDDNIKASGVVDNITRVKGWFEETIEEWVPFIGKIALLRLDGDLYSSTYVCLHHLFPLVQKGGAVIIDDWKLSGCRAACEDYFASINYKPDYFVNEVCSFIKL